MILHQLGVTSGLILKFAYRAQEHFCLFWEVILALFLYLFDVIFDEENTYKYDLVRALSSASNNRSNDLSEATNQFLYSG